MKYTGTLLMALGALMLLYYPVGWVYGKVSQLNLHHQYDRKVQVAIGNHSDSEAYCRLVIPTINLDQIVLEGTSETQLAAGPGHFPATADPGKGNCAIVGHLNTNGSPFKDLDTLRP